MLCRILALLGATRQKCLNRTVEVGWLVVFVDVKQPQVNNGVLVRHHDGWTMSPKCSSRSATSISKT
jgi:hypothetical protein